MKSDFNLEQQNQSTESKIIASLERISHAFRVLLWQESSKHSLTPIQIQVLIFLLTHDKDQRRISTLADEFNMAKATISNTIKTLEQKKLIKKDLSPEDKRSYTIKLSKKGEKLAQKTSLYTKKMHPPIQELAEIDKENMLEYLLDVIHHLNQSGIISVQRICTTCTYYEHTYNGQKHYCRLLNKNLQVSELRIDCPEHKPKE